MTSRTRTRTIHPIHPAPAAAEAVTDGLERRAAFHRARELACAELMNRARALAERLRPGRVHECHDGSFSVMFGPMEGRASFLIGPGVVELHVEVSEAPAAAAIAQYLANGTLPAPALKFSPRAGSLGANADLTTAETQGTALVEAGRLGRTLIALTA